MRMYEQVVEMFRQNGISEKQYMHHVEEDCDVICFLQKPKRKGDSPYSIIIRLGVEEILAEIYITADIPNSDKGFVLFQVNELNTLYDNIKFMVVDSQLVLKTTCFVGDNINGIFETLKPLLGAFGEAMTKFSGGLAR